MELTERQKRFLVTCHRFAEESDGVFFNHVRAGLVSLERREDDQTAQREARDLLDSLIRHDPPLAELKSDTWFDIKKNVSILTSVGREMAREIIETTKHGQQSVMGEGPTIASNSTGVHSLVGLWRAKFREALRLQDEARSNPSLYKEVAECFFEASRLSKQYVSIESEQPSNRVQAMVFGDVYEFNGHNALNAYYYENHETGKAKEHVAKGAAAISRAIAVVENPPYPVDAKAESHLKQFLPEWHCELTMGRVFDLAADARAAWDSNDFIKALDLYNKMATLEEEILAESEKGVRHPSLRRITVGNYFGTMANAAQSVAGYIQNTSRQLPEGKLGVENDQFWILVRHIYRAYLLTNEVRETLPEVDIHRGPAAQITKWLRQIIADTPDWLTFYLTFENDAEFLKLMKLVDLERFKQVEKVRHDAKGVKEPPALAATSIVNYGNLYHTTGNQNIAAGDQTVAQGHHTSVRHAVKAESGSGWFGKEVGKKVVAIIAALILALIYWLLKKHGFDLKGTP